MALSQERVEIMIDPSTRAWLPDITAVAEARRQRCALYVAMPHERRMGKVGGEAPRPVRWRPVGESPCEPANAGAGEAVPTAAGTAAAGSGAGGSPAHPVTPTAPVAEVAARVPQREPEDAPWSPADTCRPALPGESPVELEAAEAQAVLEEDPLMFTAQPADGVVLRSSVFQRLQLGVSERHAEYRYSTERLDVADLYREVALGG